MRILWWTYGCTMMDRIPNGVFCAKLGGCAFSEEGEEGEIDVVWYLHRIPSDRSHFWWERLREYCLGVLGEAAHGGREMSS